MYELSPPNQVLAFDAGKLKAPGVSIWTAWDDERLLGCAALKELSSTRGEIKSMRTPSALRRTGAGSSALELHHRCCSFSADITFCILRPAAATQHLPPPRRCTQVQASSVAVGSEPTERTGIVSSCRSR